MKVQKANIYDHLKIDKKWQKNWENDQIYKVKEDLKKKKYYVLDMFPYPSGAGLHVGHPRGYVASDVFARAKRMNGFNVLHPMGFDSFGLPAEQYAIKTGKHPGPFTDSLIKKYKKQLNIIGFSFDWNREISTHTPEFYKWTQWIFLKIYDSWYDNKKDKARPIKELIEILEKTGNKNISASCDTDSPIISAKEWKSFSKKEKQDFLMKYRLAYEGYAEVNWCADLGTVLANDEVVEVDGKMVSERGEYPVVKKKMRQWFMRITAYGSRLVEDLKLVDFPQNVKEIQKNWIGKSLGVEIDFSIKNSEHKIKIFTTRADTIDGVTYLVLAPEHPILEKVKNQITNLNDVRSYIDGTLRKSEIDRVGDKEKTGVPVRGITVINPLNGEELPVWIADYVLLGYGTGAVMAVPFHDERDNEFAKKYKLPIINKPLISVKEVVKKVKGKTVLKYKMRDAIFARQRYWGEPIPLKTQDGIISPLKEKDLPLILPKVKSYEPSGTGESPLASIKSWTKEGYETNTMPGWAGSSWYFLRYMDPKNQSKFASKKALDYWKDVDMYVGGTEHATGHLLYSRFWHKFLYDMGFVSTKEPFKTLRNQGMIGGADGQKMSKRFGNVVNPDDVVKNYGADAFRIFEMFIGPFDSHIPWSEDGIMGSRRFVDRVWRLSNKVLNQKPIDKDYKKTKEYEDQLKSINKAIKKVTEDIDTFSFNTAVSAMMICLNALEKVQYIEENEFIKFIQILAPFAPFITEEIWSNFGNKGSIHLSSWPKFNSKYIKDDVITIGVQINGKTRAELEIEKDAPQSEYEKKALEIEKIKEYTEGKEIKKLIVVLGRIVNIVVG